MAQKTPQAFGGGSGTGSRYPRRGFPILVLTLALLASSCGTDAKTDELEQRVAELETQLAAELEREQGEASRGSVGPNVVESTVPTSTTSLEATTFVSTTTPTTLPPTNKATTPILPPTTTTLQPTTTTTRPPTTTTRSPTTTTTTTLPAVPAPIAVNDAFWATFEFKGARTCISQPFTAPTDLLASMSASFTGRPAEGENATYGRFILNGWGSSKFMGYSVKNLYNDDDFTVTGSWGWVTLLAGETYRFQLETELGSAPADLLEYYQCSYTVTFARP